MHTVAFLGTPEPAVVVLRALVAAGIDVALVVSRPDRRRGRGAATTPSPVKAAALELGLAVSERAADVVTAGVDLGVVVAYGRIIARPVLEATPMVNLHFSLLPRWRGAAPVERAVLAGDAETGVCLMALEEGLDTGGVYRCTVTPIDETETVDGLQARLANEGVALLLDALRAGLGSATPQAGETTYATKIEPAELHLDWSQPARQLSRVVRLGRAWTTWRGKRLLVLAAAADDGVASQGDGAEGRGEGGQGGEGAEGRGEGGQGGEGGEGRGEAQGRGQPGQLLGDVVVTGAGGLRLLQVQPEGRGPLRAGDWLRGARPAPGETLGP